MSDARNELRRGVDRERYRTDTAYREKIRALRRNGEVPGRTIVEQVCAAIKLYPPGARFTTGDIQRKLGYRHTTPAQIAQHIRRADGVVSLKGNYWERGPLQDKAEAIAG